MEMISSPTSIYKCLWSFNSSSILLGLYL